MKMQIRGTASRRAFEYAINTEFIDHQMNMRDDKNEMRKQCKVHRDQDDHTALERLKSTISELLPRPGVR